MPNNPQCSFIRKEGSCFCWTPLRAAAEKCCHLASITVGIASSQGLYFKQHKEKKPLRCSVTLDHFHLSRSRFILKREELRFNSFAQFSSWWQEAFGYGAECAPAHDGHAHPRRRSAAGRPSEHGLPICFRSLSWVIPWISTQRHMSRGYILIIGAFTGQTKYKVPLSSPWNFRLSSLNLHAWISGLWMF